MRHKTCSGMEICRPKMGKVLANFHSSRMHLRRNSMDAERRCHSCKAITIEALCSPSGYPVTYSKEQISYNIECDFCFLLWSAPNQLYHRGRDIWLRLKDSPHGTILQPYHHDKELDRSDIDYSVIHVTVLEGQCKF